MCGVIFRGNLFTSLYYLFVTPFVNFFLFAKLFGMEFLKAAFLGLVEGVTEFLPVSSTGHLILAGQWVGFTGERAKTFEIFIQLGAILAVVWLYRKKIFAWNDNGCKMRTAALTSSVSRISSSNLRLGLNVLIAFLPAAIAGLLLHDFVKKVLFSPSVVAASLIIGGILIFVIEGFLGKWAGGIANGAALENISWKKSLAIGFAQILALIPGVSRSAATILGGMVFGLSRVAATEFSFFLAIPTIFAATIYDLWKSMGGGWLSGGGLAGEAFSPGLIPSGVSSAAVSPILSSADVPIFIVGFIVSFFSALIVIKFFLRFVSTHTFRPFAWYRIAIGIVVFLAVRNGF